MVVGRIALAVLMAGLVCVPPAVGAAAVPHTMSTSMPQTSIRVHDRGGSVSAPGRVHPAMTHIYNDSRHELIVVRRRDYGRPRLLADLRRGNGPILAGRLAGDFLIVDTVRPHGNMFTTMTRGTYLLADRHPLQGTTASDVAVTRAAGSWRNGPVPAARSEVRITRQNKLDMPNPTYSDSALYTANRGTHTTQIRLYKLASRVRADSLSAFTAHPTWSRLARLPVSNAYDLATLAAGHSVSDTKMPATGRYVALAVPLLHHQTGRPHLQRKLVAVVKIRE